MIYPKFHNIIINNRVGVSPVGKDTLLIAEKVSKLTFNRALEVGTGTGFVPIYLRTLNRQCEGIDINPQAIACAIENARLNDVHANFYLSDLFSKVKDNFDLVIFNPPYGNIRSTYWSRYLEVIKSLLPKENVLIDKITYPLIRNSRRQLISLFLNKARYVLEESGCIVILLHHTELDLIEGLEFNIIESLRDQRLMLVRM